MIARCNLITGLLGAGKTTLIRHLLASRPAGERWAVIVNEFGIVGIDGTTLAAGGQAGVDGRHAVSVREVAGGCICCAANVPLRVAITDVLRRVRPDRLLIEPSGLGHPAAILATLAQPGLAASIRIDSVVCVVDARQLDTFGTDRACADTSPQPASGIPGVPGATDTPGAAGSAASPADPLAGTWHDQILAADVVVANKRELATGAQLDRFAAFADAIYPPRQAVVFTSEGQMDPALLDAGRIRWRPVLLQGHDGQPDFNAGSQPVSGLGARHSAGSMGVYSVGWLFDGLAAGAVFRADDLERLLGGLPARLALSGARLLRAKGALRTDRGSRLMEWSAGQLRSTPLAFAGPGRLELLIDGNIPLADARLAALETELGTTLTISDKAAGPGAATS